jgi:hypothetical protein
MGIGLVVVQLAYQAALWYFIVATIMRLHVVVAEDRGPWHGLVGSYNLVKGNWWRTLAVLAVLGAVYGLLVLPIVLPTIIPFINFIIGFASEHRGGGPLAPDEVAVLLSHIGDIFSPLVMGLLGVLGAAFSLMSINSLTALYVDLRARRGDFGEDDDHDDLVLTFPS